MLSIRGFHFRPPAPPPQHTTEWSTGSGVGGGGKSPHRQLPSTVGVDGGPNTPGDPAGGDAQSEPALIVLFVCSRPVFLPAALRKKPSSAVTP